MKKFTRAEVDKDFAKANKLLDEAKKLQINLDVWGAERKLREAKEALEKIKAKYVPEKVTFT